jgi:hypothetical protein
MKPKVFRIRILRSSIANMFLKVVINFFIKGIYSVTVFPPAFSIEATADLEKAWA